MGGRRRIVALALGAALALTMVPQPATAAAVRVKVKDNLFKPKRTTVEKGTRVKWVNRGDTDHTTTSTAGLWDEVLAPGERFRRKFRKTGTYRYFCQFHDGMRGRIIVVA